MASHWATFDCYGTLVDWNAGIARELKRLFGAKRAPRLLARFHELEPEIQRQAYRTYREVLALALTCLAEEEAVALPEGEAGALADSLPGWPVFEEVPATLGELRERGFRLAILSNSDRDLIAASQLRISVPFDVTVVAEDVGSYKPEHAHWDRFFELTAADRGRHVHVAASVFHDVAPAAELGLTSVWINRLGEPPDERPARELPDLAGLPDVLDALVEP